MKGIVHRAEAVPRRWERMSRSEPRCAWPVWFPLAMLRMAFLFLIVVLPLLADGNVSEVPAAIHVEMGATAPVEHGHASTARDCHTVSTCVVHDVAGRAEPVSPYVANNQQRFTNHDKLDLPSRRLPVDLPPPRLFV